MQEMWILFMWFAVTSAVNFLMRKRTAAEWEAFAETNPRAAAFVRMVRAVGVDPAKLIQSLVDFVRAESHKRLGAPVDGTVTTEQPTEEKGQP